jgi:hypothetical protein
VAFTYRGSLVARALKDFLDLNKNSLGLNVVYYGDQTTIPTVPAACVEPALTTRDITGIPYQTDNNFTVNIIIYHTSLDGTENIQEECDNISELVQDAVNLESISSQYGGTQLSGLVVHGHSARLEYGYRMLANKLMRANRVIWTGFTKTKLVG